jgi:hypothetical protein
MLTAFVSHVLHVCRLAHDKRAEDFWEGARQNNCPNACCRVAFSMNVTPSSEGLHESYLTSSSSPRRIRLSIDDILLLPGPDSIYLLAFRRKSSSVVSCLHSDTPYTRHKHCRTARRPFRSNFSLTVHAALPFLRAFLSLAPTQHGVVR